MNAILKVLGILALSSYLVEKGIGWHFTAAMMGLI